VQLTEMTKIEHPIGRMLSLCGKGYLQLLRARLQHLDINRYYYTLVLIDSRDGLITQQELALLLDSDKVSIVRMVDYLSEKGFVKRIRKTEDRRKHSLFVTDKAKLAIPQIKKAFVELNETVLSGLSDSQIKEFTDTLQLIKKNITANTPLL
jgi:MarR family transcriptional regulator, transcriptional regulator for hemolysin